MQHEPVPSSAPALIGDRYRDDLVFAQDERFGTESLQAALRALGFADPAPASPSTPPEHVQAVLAGRLMSVAAIQLMHHADTTDTFRNLTFGLVFPLISETGGQPDARAAHAVLIEMIRLLAEAAGALARTDRVVRDWSDQAALQTVAGGLSAIESLYAAMMLPGHPPREDLRAARARLAAMAAVLDDLAPGDAS